MPDASGCWCDGFGYRWRVNGEPEEATDRRITEGCIFCVCPKGEAEFQKRLTDAAERRESWLRDRRLAAWYDGNIPPRFSGDPDGGPGLDTSPLLKTHPEVVARLRRTMIEFTLESETTPRRTASSAGSWLLWGGYGSGKTGLAVGYARQFVWPDAYPEAAAWAPTSIGFATLPDLMTELRATYNRRSPEEPTEAEVLQRYRRYGLLILDDLGAEQVKDTGWLEDRLYQIIGQRHSDETPIVFTSNLSPAQLGARIGERNMWRVVEMCGENIIHVDGPNLRASKGVKR